jgi:hypothetical protein
MLIPIVLKEEIAEAQEAFKKSLMRGAKRLRRDVGFKGDQVKDVEIYWNPDSSLWAGCKELDNRYWNIFGCQDPSTLKALSIVVEINMPTEGKNRRVAAFFAKDTNKRIYLVHSGKIGGGRAGITKDGLLNLVGADQMVRIHWDDKDTDGILIGQVGAPNLPRQVADFVRKVDRFKRHSVSEEVSLPEIFPTFSPEFSGQRKSYTFSETIQSSCDHGLVITALKESVTSMGLQAANDRYRDLFLYDKDNRIFVLFEAKTDISTSNIYGAIGQLMFHGASEDPSPRKVLVVPENPNSKTDSVLRKLGIEVLPYVWQDGEPTFPGLRKLNLAGM